MTALDYILEGLSKNLEVERELGTCTVEIDRALVTGVEKPACPILPPEPVYDFVFLHHIPLDPAGVEMMAKIVTAMKTTPERAPIVFRGTLPKARYYVVLGKCALAHWFPTVRCAMDKWTRDEIGDEILYTHSPDEFTRFGTVPKTSPLYRQKAEMWNALKTVMQRLKQ